MRGPAKHLTKGVAIYGAGDAATTIVNFFLLTVYVKGNFLSTAEFGALGLIQSIEAYAKVISRWGLDGAFMRFYHDRTPGDARRTLTSTIVWFVFAANALLFGAALIVSPWLASSIRLDGDHVVALQVMLVNIFLIAFTFVPFHVMRLEDRAVAYSGFTLARSVGQIVLRILLVIVLKKGITGMYLADIIITLVLLPLMARWYLPLLGFRFSTVELRKALRFGLPRLPHGIASQTLDANPKLTLGQHVAAAEVGIYQNAVTLGTGVAFFKNAFETAFAPFYYSTARQADAKVVFSKTATYGIAVFALIVAGTVAVARDAIVLVLKPEYLEALPVVPMVAVAFAFQGFYQLTSIGLNLTSRTEFYSAATITAALVSVGLGWWLIPHYHVVGAAVTVLVSYGTQFTIAAVLAQRLYHVPYEIGRIVRVLAASAAAALAGLWLVPPVPAWAGLLLRGVVTTAVYGGILWGTGFFRPTERAFLREMIARMRRRASIPPAPTNGDR